jgi:hypothetical protein
LRQHHAEHADFWPLGRREVLDGFEGHVRREQEELDRDQLLRTLLGRMGERAGAAKAPDDHHARDTLDDRVDAEAISAIDPARMPAVMAIPPSRLIRTRLNQDE